MTNLTPEMVEIFTTDIASSEKFIAELHNVQIVSNGFVCAYEKTLICFQPNHNGGWESVNGISALPMSLRIASNNCKRVINGHNEHPIPMKHSDFINALIKTQTEHIEFLNKLLNQ